MKILVTGGGGQLGTELAATCPDSWQCIALSRSELDISDPEAVLRSVDAIAPDVLVNAAAYTAVDRAENEAAAAHRINGEAVERLADLCGERAIRLVHFSTDFVFDGEAACPYGVDAQTAPIGVYGLSKREGEIAALKEPANLVIRAAWVYGVHGANFVKTMLRLMAERDSLGVVADQVGTPTHTASLAMATWKLVEAQASGIHHFTDAGVASWYDFAVAIQELAIQAGLLDRKIPVLPIATSDYPTPARRPSYSVLDKARTWDLLGGPARHWREELQDMLSRLKDPQNG